jgi:hypothetical protein
MAAADLGIAVGESDLPRAKQHLSKADSQFSRRSLHLFDLSVCGREKERRERGKGKRWGHRARKSKS